jgi:flagellum-specific peptidoglycan hydrolase FlgJ
MAFVWGDGGAQLTPEAIAAQRKVAQAMMARGADYSPVQSAWQGAARMSEGLLGGFDAGNADVADRANNETNRQLMAAMLGGAGGAQPAVATPAVAPVAPGPMGATAIPAGKEEFVSTIMPLAQEAAAKTGVDPRLIVAQAALESGWGKSAPGNNLFGIKSHGAPGGNVLPTTEVVNGQPVQTRDSFAAYASPADSVNGYADFINKNPRYGAMKSAQGLDAQVAALGQSGYATDPNYAAKVGSIARGLPAPVAAVPGPNEASPLDTAAYPAGPMAAAPPSAGVQRVAQAMPPAAPSGVNPAIIAGMTHPAASAQTRALATTLYQSQAKSDAPTDELKEYKFDAAQRAAAGKPPIGFSDWKTELKKAGAVNVTTNVDKGESSFAKAAGTAQAKRYDDLAADGQQAQQMISDINTLTDLGKNIGTGKTAEFKAAIGPYAEALGIKVDGLSDIQAYEGIINRVAPSLRVKGSGAQSDYELKNFLKSLPALGNTPEGNAISAATMKGLQENKIKAAEIGSMALNGDITRAEAEKQLRTLPDPMNQYREYMKTNRGAPTATGAKPADEGWKDLGGGIRIREKK